MHAWEVGVYESYRSCICMTGTGNMTLFGQETVWCLIQYQIHFVLYVFVLIIQEHELCLCYKPLIPILVAAQLRLCHLLP